MPFNQYTVLVIRKALLAVALSAPLATAFAQSAGDVTPIASASPVTCEDAGESSSKLVKSVVGFTAAVEVKAVHEGKGEERRCLDRRIFQSDEERTGKYLAGIRESNSLLKSFLGRTHALKSTDFYRPAHIRLAL
jgi:hypothetical protein